MTFVKNLVDLPTSPLAGIRNWVDLLSEHLPSGRNLVDLLSKPPQRVAGGVFLLFPTLTGLKKNSRSTLQAVIFVKNLVDLLFRTLTEKEKTVDLLSKLLPLVRNSVDLFSKPPQGVAGGVFLLFSVLTEMKKNNRSTLQALTVVKNRVDLLLRPLTKVKKSGKFIRKLCKSPKICLQQIGL